jgi:small subunit ribosomal protein S1
MERSEEPIEEEKEPESINGEEVSHPMDAFLEEKAYGMDSPRRGEIRTGTIARITDSDILVDIGFKSEGVIPSREFEQIPPDQLEELTVGTEVTVYIIRTGGSNGTTLLSLSRAEEEKDWIEAERLLKSKDVFEGEISGYNKGGLIVKLGQIRGFIPASQVSMSRKWRSDGESPDERWGKMVGEPIVTKVIEVERRRNRLILSERGATREARDVLKERLISELKPGEVREGHVISLADFGAFVDIGGADGLVHTSEISWKRISHPKDVLKVGQEVQVKVLSIDPKQKRISLSLRELEDDPWDAIAAQYNEGQLVEGSITKLTKFGAFASLKGASDYEVEGLIHISELSDRHIVHPREVVSEEETLTLRVIRVDRERRRIGLSLKRVDSPEYAESDWQAAMQEINSEEEASSEELESKDDLVDEFEAAMLAAEEQLTESEGEELEQTDRIEPEAELSSEESEESEATEPLAESSVDDIEETEDQSELELEIEATSEIEETDLEVDTDPMSEPAVNETETEAEAEDEPIAEASIEDTEKTEDQTELELEVEVTSEIEEIDPEVDSEPVSETTINETAVNATDAEVEDEPVAEASIEDTEETENQTELELEVEVTSEIEETDPEVDSEPVSETTIDETAVNETAVNETELEAEMAAEIETELEASADAQTEDLQDDNQDQ